MVLSFFKIRKSAYILIFLFYFHAIINAQIVTADTSANIIDLGSANYITKIEATTINSNPYNYLLGLFEGSTDSSFSDGFPIAMITDDVVDNPGSISVTAKCKEQYRYIRYLPPNGNNAQLKDIKIYGGSEDSYFRATDLPLMVIKVDNSVEPESTEVYINSTVTIINTNGNKL